MNTSKGVGFQVSIWGEMVWEEGSVSPQGDCVSISSGINLNWEGFTVLFCD